MDTILVSILRCKSEMHRRVAQEPLPAFPPKPVLVYFLYQMDFEFDPAKSAANLKKHGIDFVGAQVLWSDPDRLEIPARSLDEPRAQVIGRIGEVVWSAFVTMRNNRIRIISVRRARDEEQAAYLQD
jgi:uncharacterized DUF497 family protein